MVHAKNYETMFKFVQVMPRILWLLFSGYGVYATSIFWIVADVYSADNVTPIMNLKAISRETWFCLDFFIFIRKRCYRSENRAMPLWTLIRIEIYSCIARFSLRYHGFLVIKQAKTYIIVTDIFGLQKAKKKLSCRSNIRTVQSTIL